jgi:predicted nucleotidyltransferase
MRFTDLVEAMVTQADVRAAIDALLVLKHQASEAAAGAPVPVLQAFIARELAELEVAKLATSKTPHQPLDDLLCRTVTGAVPRTLA